MTEIVRPMHPARVPSRPGSQETNLADSMPLAERPKRPAATLPALTLLTVCSMMRPACPCGLEQPRTSHSLFSRARAECHRLPRPSESPRSWSLRFAAAQPAGAARWRTVQLPRATARRYNPLARDRPQASLQPAFDRQALLLEACRECLPAPACCPLKPEPCSIARTWGQPNRECSSRRSRPPRWRERQQPGQACAPLPAPQRKRRANPIQMMKAGSKRN